MKIVVTAMLCAAWCASAANAEIVHFINPAPGQPGHYDWHWSPLHGSVSWLDITLAASAQSNTSSGNSVAQLSQAFFGSINRNATGGAQLLAIDGYTSPLLFGAPVAAGGAGDWSNTSWHVADTLPEPFTLLPLGERHYLGVRTADGRHGWIEVEVASDFMGLTAFSWAYETQPGVPIVAGQIPSPGAAVLLALASLTTRRRRS